MVSFEGKQDCFGGWKNQASDDFSSTREFGNVTRALDGQERLERSMADRHPAERPRTHGVHEHTRKLYRKEKPSR